MGVVMAFEEKRAWILGVVSVIAYGTYLVVVLGRAGATPLARVPYVWPLVWVVGLSIVVSIVANIAVAVVTPKDDTRTDVRDREIGRFGEHIGNSFVVIGAIAALLLAMAEAAHFWIANAVYLAFTLSAVLQSLAKIAAYRRGLPS
ncbi:hypothetical protein GCM10029964_072230 [Kibdelosporangium lantanae]